MAKRRRPLALSQNHPDISPLSSSNPIPKQRMDVEAPKQGLQQSEGDTGTSNDEDSVSVELHVEKEEDDRPMDKKKRKRTRTRKKKGKSTAVTSTVSDDAGTDAASREAGEDGSGKARNLKGDGVDLRTGVTDTVYVEGIPWTCDEEDVREFFKGCGKITAVRMPRWQDSGRPRGYAHVAFAGLSGARAAFGLDGQYLKGRYLTIQEPQEPATEKVRRANRSAEQPRGCQTVFVKNLPYDADEDGVREALAGCGRITSVRLAMWNHTRKLKGFGYVEFVSERGAEACVRMQEKLSVGGRPLVVDFETGAPKGSFRRQDGAQIKKTSANAGVGRGKPAKFKRVRA